MPDKTELLEKVKKIRKPNEDSLARTELREEIKKVASMIASGVISGQMTCCIARLNGPPISVARSKEIEESVEDYKARAEFLKKI